MFQILYILFLSFVLQQTFLPCIALPACNGSLVNYTKSKVDYTSTTDSSTTEELIPATTIKAMAQNGPHVNGNIEDPAAVSPKEGGMARDDLNKSQEMKNTATKREEVNEIIKMPSTTAASFVDKETLNITTTSRSAATDKITTNTLIAQSDVLKNEETLLKTAKTKGDLIKFTTPLPIINISTHKTTMDETTTEAIKHIEISSAPNINCALQPCIDNATCMLPDLCKCAPGYTWYEPINGSGDQMQPMCAAIVEHGSNDMSATLSAATDEIIADEEAYPAVGSIINVTDKTMDETTTLGKATDEIIADEEAYPAEGSIINVTDKTIYKTITLGKATDEIIADEEAYPAEGSIINVTDKTIYKTITLGKATDEIIADEEAYPAEDVITNDHEDYKLIYSIIGGCAIFVALIILLTYLWRKHI